MMEALSELDIRGQVLIMFKVKDSADHTKDENIEFLSRIRIIDWPLL